MALLFTSYDYLRFTTIYFLKHQSKVFQSF
uniref:Uncharacterized protein n=1 Tax=Physcomitrium patens TaxID=3218 RepID=A0A2K1L7J8_PHYPA|nr:hypothetical protein PHYPA_000421 [Physcomitrium patens]